MQFKLQALLAQADEGSLLQPAIDSIQEMFDSLLTGGPKVLVWILFVAVGWILLKLVSRLLGGFIRKIGGDDVAERLGVSGVLGQMGIASPFSKFVATILFWILFLQFILISSQQFELEWLTEPLESVIAFLPRAITAFIIVMIGFIVSDLVRNAILRSADRMGLDYARSLSNLAFGFLVLLSIIIAVRQIGIDTDLLEDVVKIAMVGVALAFALALGLGLHHMTRNVVSAVYARDLYPSGTQIEYDGEMTTVVGVGAVTTKLEKSDGSFVMVPNSELVSSVTRGSTS